MQQSYTFLLPGRAISIYKIDARQENVKIQIEFLGSITIECAQFACLVNITT